MARRDHGVDGHRVLAVQPQHPDLQQRTITGWPDQHAEIVIELDPTHAMAHRMHDVLIGDAVLPCRLPDRRATPCSAVFGGTRWLLTGSSIRYRYM
ncbi:MAG: hypothetical protein M0Z63_11485 [Actinomycetota bacterium]|nr:hypothetical protein [Actinomycetota bacterium]